MNIKEIVKACSSYAIELRRDFHRHPELGNEEFKTADRIEAELKQLGIQTERMLGTGVIGILHGGKSSDRVVALRADIDALPMTECSGLDFSSEIPGQMHSCGHDVHTAVLLGTAKALSEIREEVAGIIKFLFQPAEETTGGAERMIEAGALKNPDAEYILGLHVVPSYPAGTIRIKYGKMQASSDMFVIKVKGVSCHGAYPHLGVDAIVAASQIVLNLQTVVSRNIAPINSAVIAIGTFHGGTAGNIVADEVTLSGTMRALDPETRELLKKRLVETAKHTAESMGASAEVEIIKGYDPLINHDEVVDLVKEAVVEQLGEDALHIGSNAYMGVEDFAFFLQEVKGAFFELGSGFENIDNPPLHSENFKINEDCIETGILTEVSAVLKLLENKESRSIE